MADKEIERMIFARLNNLQDIVTAQRTQIDRLHTALQGHQRIFEVLMPGAMATEAEMAKKIDACQYN